MDQALETFDLGFEFADRSRVALRFEVFDAELLADAVTDVRDALIGGLGAVGGGADGIVDFAAFDRAAAPQQVGLAARHLKFGGLATPGFDVLGQGREEFGDFGGFGLGGFGFGAGNSNPGPGGGDVFFGAGLIGGGGFGQGPLVQQADPGALQALALDKQSGTKLGDAGFVGELPRGGEPGFGGFDGFAAGRDAGLKLGQAVPGQLLASDDLFGGFAGAHDQGLPEGELAIGQVELFLGAVMPGAGIGIKKHGSF